jgi:surface antigen
LVLASCAANGSRSSHEAAPDTFYDGLSIDEAAAARQAVQEALESRPSDETYRWTYANGISGSVTPLRTFRIKTGHFCRDYAETIATGPQPPSTLRTACRDGQGTWRVVER